MKNVRNHDPVRNHMSRYESEELGIAELHRKLILEAVTNCPGLTIREISALSRLDYSVVARRVKEIKEISKGFKTECSISHIISTTWWPIDA